MTKYNNTSHCQLLSRFSAEASSCTEKAKVQVSSRYIVNILCEIFNFKVPPITFRLLRVFRSQQKIKAYSRSGFLNSAISALPNNGTAAGPGSMFPILQSLDCCWYRWINQTHDAMMASGQNNSFVVWTFSSTLTSTNDVILLQGKSRFISWSSRLNSVLFRLGNQPKTHPSRYPNAGNRRRSKANMTKLQIYFILGSLQ